MRVYDALANVFEMDKEVGVGKPWQVKTYAFYVLNDTFHSRTSAPGEP